MEHVFYVSIYKTELSLALLRWVFKIDHQLLVIKSDRLFSNEEAEIIGDPYSIFHGDLEIYSNLKALKKYKWNIFGKGKTFIQLV